jgi:hypothetical protein
MTDSQTELEKVATAYELLDSNNPPDLESYLLVCNNTIKTTDSPLRSKLSKSEISENFLWEKVIEERKNEIAENILFTADKAKALNIKESSQGSLYQFKGSNEWLSVNDYAETLLHQPFEDQLTHLFRFLLINEFSAKEVIHRDYSIDVLTDFYFDQDDGFPNKFFFIKALHENFSLFIWHKKKWLKLDDAKNHEEKISLKSLIDSKVLEEKLKNKIYFDGFTQSLSEAIYDSIKDFTSPYAEYEKIALGLNLFHGIISSSLILEKLEILGYRNKSFISDLMSKEISSYYLEQAKSLLRSYLGIIDEIESGPETLLELINLSGIKNRTTLIDLEASAADGIVLAGLAVLINKADETKIISQNNLSINEGEEDITLKAYEVFLPWWHAVSRLAHEHLTFVEIKNSLNEYFKKNLSSRDHDYSNFQDSSWSGQIQMELLEQYDYMKLKTLILDTPRELVEQEKKQKAWGEVDTIITSAYQHKISRSALSVQLLKVINNNKPHLDNASNRLEQLLDLYENNIINN